MDRPLTSHLSLNVLKYDITSTVSSGQHQTIVPMQAGHLSSSKQYTSHAALRIKRNNSFLPALRRCVRAGQRRWGLPNGDYQDARRGVLGSMVAPGSTGQITALNTDIEISYPPKTTTIRGSLQPPCPVFNHIYRHIQVGPGIDQHLDQGLVSSCAGVHQRRHPLCDKQSYIDAWKRRNNNVKWLPQKNLKYSSQHTSYIQKQVFSTWSSMLLTPSGPSRSMAWPMRSVRPQLSIRKPKSSWNLSVAALESRRLKELKQHSGLMET